MKAQTKETAEHYRWGSNCDGWFLLKSDDVHVIEERMPPGTAEQRHRHQRARQLFYVLEGELTMRFEQEDVMIRARQSLEVAPGVLHQARNDSSSEVSFLVVSVPPSHGDRVNE